MTGEKTRKVLSVAAAAAISAALLYLISRRVDMRAALGQWSRADPAMVAGALGTLFAAAYLIQAYKWRLLLRWKGMPLAFLEVLRIKLSAAVFHSGLPLKLGAVTEGLYLSRAFGFKLDHALSTIVFDMLMNFSALVFFAVIGVASVGFEGGIGGIPRAAWVASGVVALAGLLMPLTGPGLRVIERAVGLLPGRPGAFADGLLEGFRGLRTGRKFALAGLALLMQAVGYFILYFAMRAFGLDVPPGYIAVTAPIIYLAGAVPVSVAGFGVREWMVILFYVEHRNLMTAEQAVGAAMFAGVVVVLFNVCVSIPFLSGYLRRIAEGPGSRRLEPAP